MVPTRGTDLVSTYGFDVIHWRGRGSWTNQFWSLHPILDFFHCREGAGINLYSSVLKSKSNSGKNWRVQVYLPNFQPNFQPLQQAYVSQTVSDVLRTWRLINRKSSDANILFSDGFSLAREHFQTEMMGACAKSYLVFLFLLLQQNMGKNYLYRVYRYYFDFSSGTLFCHIWQYCVD